MSAAGASVVCLSIRWPARFVIQGRDAAPSASQDSAAPAAFHLDAKAAPASALRVSGLASTPRKWVSGGAPTIPCMHERAAARLPFDADSAVIDSRYKPARQREILGGSTSGLTHSSAAKRRLRGTWPPRLCRRKAWLVIGEVATQNERNGTCRRMSLPGERARCCAVGAAPPSQTQT